MIQYLHTILKEEEHVYNCETSLNRRISYSNFCSYYYYAKPLIFYFFCNLCMSGTSKLLFGKFNSSLLQLAYSAVVKVLI